MKVTFLILTFAVSKHSKFIFSIYTHKVKMADKLVAELPFWERVTSKSSFYDGLIVFVCLSL